MQALNLFHRRLPSVFTGDAFVAAPSDAALAQALRVGVECIVLRSEMPVSARRRLALLLNSTHDYKWGVDSRGAVDMRGVACENARYTQFEAISKILDSEALTGLVRLELGLKTSDDRSPIPDAANGRPYPKSRQFAHLGLDGRGKKRGADGSKL